MPITLAVPLDLPDVRVLADRMLEDGTVLIEVESTVQTAQCHRCGRTIDRFHGFDRPTRLRHLPVFGREVLIEIRPKRYRCPFCEGGPTSTQRCSRYEPNRPHTRAFEQDVLKRLVHSTVADISGQCYLGVKAVEGIVNQHVASAVDWSCFTALDTPYKCRFFMSHLRALVMIRYQGTWTGRARVPGNRGREVTADD